MPSHFLVSVESGIEIPCEVLRVGQRYEERPVRSAGDRPATETALPVTLRLPAELPAGATLRLGAEVRVPVIWLGGA